MDSNNKTYVHYSMRISRSSSVVIAYVILKKINFNDAFKFDKSKRKSILPNPGSVEQLKEFEEILVVCHYNKALLDFA